jgi:hypothetical protein
MPLTDLEIRRSKPREKPYTLNDGSGLSLLIEPNGSKGWRFRYRFDGKPKMLSLGTYPLIFLTEARQKRDEAKKLVVGINPSDVRKRKAGATEEGEIPLRLSPASGTKSALIAGLLVMPKK